MPRPWRLFERSYPADTLSIPHLTFDVRERQRFLLIDRRHRRYATRIAKLTDQELVRTHHSLLLLLHDGGHDKADTDITLAKLSRCAAELARRLADAKGEPSVIQELPPDPKWREPYETVPGPDERPRSG